MRDNGAQALLGGLSRKLDDARSFIDSAVPAARCLPAFTSGLAPLRLPNLQQRVQRTGAVRPQRQPAGTVVCPSGRFAALIPGDGVVEQVFTSGIGSFFQLYNAALIGRLILTWFPNPPAFIVQPLSTICDPYLNLFRGIIPPLGGTIDLSPILAFIVLDVFTNSARALPCELGADGQMVQPPQQKGWTPGRGLAAWRQRQAARRQQEQARRAKARQA